METHHHGHVHHEKKWKEYLFQFFMLFLAVFCGSLAEYQLEHKIEKDRAKEFAESLVVDLEKDTVSMKDHIKFRELIIANADSLAHLLTNGSFESEPEQAFRNFTGMGYLALLGTYRGTIEQLKASGALRYFKNKQLTTTIIDYYNLLDEAHHRIQFIFDYTSNNQGRFVIAHLDARYNDTIFRRQNKIAPFRNISEDEKVQLYNISSKIKGYNHSLAVETLPEALKEAEELIIMIKKEYEF